MVKQLNAFPEGSNIRFFNVCRSIVMLVKWEQLASYIIFGGTNHTYAYMPINTNKEITSSPR